MLISRFVAVVVFGCCLASFEVSAQERLKNGNTPVDTTEDLREFQRLRVDCDERLRLCSEAFQTKYEKAKTAGERERLMTSFRSETATIVGPAIRKALQLVGPHAAEGKAIEPLIWIASQDSADESPTAASLLIEHHLTNEKTIELAFGNRRSREKWVERMLRAQVADRDLPEDERPRQMLALAQTLVAIAERKQGDVKLLENEAIQLFTDLGQKYSDEEYRGGVTYQDLSTSSLFEIMNLGIGKMVPEIEGEDLDGVAFKLSDYRGKVIMISFWASWCGPCMAEVPHERELVKRYIGRPFVLIGVNGDPNKGAISGLLEKKQIPWRSFWCGEKGPFGPIPRKWNVNTWPTVFLIDHQGLIRAKSARDAMIEKLVVEAEKAKK
jgi:thiol-disulfide isomerase/thioredoxin